MPKYQATTPFKWGGKVYMPDGDLLDLSEKEAAGLADLVEPALSAEADSTGVSVVPIKPATKAAGRPARKTARSK